MAKSALVGKIHINCPVCSRLHEVEERSRMNSTSIKGEKVFYEEHFYVCSESQENGERREFQTESLTDLNLMAARNAYRREHHLLTAGEIVQVREGYGLTQAEASRLLGWGGATIARYESRAIQDEAYDTLLRMISKNPFEAIAFLDKNGEQFSELKRMQIRTKMIEKLELYGKEYLARQVFASEYVNFSIPSDFNGYKLLDIDKLEGIVSYYAERQSELYKVRLMNMLWYADALHFKTYGSSMTGLVYRHEAMGVLPVGDTSLMALKNVNVTIQEDYESTGFRFYPNTALDLSVLSKNETSVLESVIAKFKNYDTSLMVSYIQEESACAQTEHGNIIPYSLAKKVRTL